MSDQKIQDVLNQKGIDSSHQPTSQGKSEHKVGEDDADEDDDYAMLIKEMQ